MSHYTTRFTLLMSRLTSFTPAHTCPRCKVKSFSRTSNLYRHMRNCEKVPGRVTGDVTSGSDTAAGSAPGNHFEEHLRLSRTRATSSGKRALAASNATTQPKPPADDAPKPEDVDLSRIPGADIVPDPSWGPDPLATWVPKRRYSIHSVPTSPVPLSSPGASSSSSTSGERFRLPIAQVVFSPNLTLPASSDDSSSYPSDPSPSNSASPPEPLSGSASLRGPDGGQSSMEGSWSSADMEEVVTESVDQAGMGMDGGNGERAPPPFPASKAAMYIPSSAPQDQLQEQQSLYHSSVSVASTSTSPPTTTSAQTATPPNISFGAFYYQYSDSGGGATGSGSSNSTSPQSTSYLGGGQTPTPFSGYTPHYSSVPPTPSFPTGAFIVSHASSDTESRGFYAPETPSSHPGGDAAAYFDLSTS